MTVQHVIRFVGCLLCFVMGIAAAYDGASLGDLGFAVFPLYIAYAVATTEVRDDSTTRESP